MPIPPTTTPREMTPAQRAALHDAARRRAIDLRQQALRDAPAQAAQAARWAHRLWRRLAAVPSSHREATPCPR